MQQRTKALSISKAVRDAVRKRDSFDGCPCCILCGRPYGKSEAHYISRSHSGLGIEQNIVTLCRTCHRQLDTGPGREELHRQVKEYLKSKYPGWNEEALYYAKQNP